MFPQPLGNGGGRGGGGGSNGRPPQQQQQQPTRPPITLQEHLQLADNGQLQVTTRTGPLANAGQLSLLERQQRQQRQQRSSSIAATGVGPNSILFRVESRPPGTASRNRMMRENLQQQQFSQRGVNTQLGLRMPLHPSMVVNSLQGEDCRCPDHAPALNLTSSRIVPSSGVSLLYQPYQQQQQQQHQTSVQRSQHPRASPQLPMHQSGGVVDSRLLHQQQSQQYNPINSSGSSSRSSSASNSPARRNVQQQQQIRQPQQQPNILRRGNHSLLQSQDVLRQRRQQMQQRMTGSLQQQQQHQQRIRHSSSSSGGLSSVQPTQYQQQLYQYQQQQSRSPSPPPPHQMNSLPVPLEHVMNEPRIVELSPNNELSVAAQAVAMHNRTLHQQQQQQRLQNQLPANSSASTPSRPPRTAGNSNSGQRSAGIRSGGSSSNGSSRNSSPSSNRNSAAASLMGMDLRVHQNRSATDSGRSAASTSRAPPASALMASPSDSNQPVSAGRQRVNQPLKMEVDESEGATMEVDDSPSTRSSSGSRSSRGRGRAGSSASASASASVSGSGLSTSASSPSTEAPPYRVTMFEENQLKMRISVRSSSESAGAGASASTSSNTAPVAPPVSQTTTTTSTAVVGGEFAAARPASLSLASQTLASATAPAAPDSAASSGRSRSSGERASASAASSTNNRMTTRRSARMVASASVPNLASNPSAAVAAKSSGESVASGRQSASSGGRASVGESTSSGGLAPTTGVATRSRARSLGTGLMVSAESTSRASLLSSVLDETMLISGFSNRSSLPLPNLASSTQTNSTNFFSLRSKVMQAINMPSSRATTRGELREQQQQQPEPRASTSSAAAAAATPTEPEPEAPITDSMSRLSVHSPANGEDPPVPASALTGANVLALRRRNLPRLFCRRAFPPGIPISLPRGYVAEAAAAVEQPPDSCNLCRVLSMPADSTAAGPSNAEPPPPPPPLEVVTLICTQCDPPTISCSVSAEQLLSRHYPKGLMYHRNAGGPYRVQTNEHVITFDLKYFSPSSTWSQSEDGIGDPELRCTNGNVRPPVRIYCHDMVINPVSSRRRK